VSDSACARLFAALCDDNYLSHVHLRDFLIPSADTSKSPQAAAATLKLLKELLQLGYLYPVPVKENE
jgi:hypothetical protein